MRLFTRHIIINSEQFEQNSVVINTEGQQQRAALFDPQAIRI